MRGRRRADLAPLAIAWLAAIGCVGERERLDAPSVRLELDDDVVAAGSSITGTVTATDRSGGIILVSVRAEAGDSAFRQRADFVGTDSVSVLFNLHIAANALEGSPIVVRATVLDQQSFQTVAEDTAAVLVPTP